MNPELTAHAVENKPTADDDFDDEVGDIVVDVLPSELDRTWFDGLGDDPWLEENETLLRFAFWDAARAVVEAMLRAGYTLTPPKS